MLKEGKAVVQTPCASNTNTAVKENFNKRLFKQKDSTRFCTPDAHNKFAHVEIQNQKCREHAQDYKVPLQTRFQVLQDQSYTNDVEHDFGTGTTNIAAQALTFKSDKTEMSKYWV